MRIPKVQQKHQQQPLQYHINQQSLASFLMSPRPQGPISTISFDTTTTTTTSTNSPVVNVTRVPSIPSAIYSGAYDPSTALIQSHAQTESQPNSGHPPQLQPQNLSTNLGRPLIHPQNLENKKFQQQPLNNFLQRKLLAFNIQLNNQQQQQHKQLQLQKQQLQLHLQQQQQLQLQLQKQQQRKQQQQQQGAQLVSNEILIHPTLAKASQGLVTTHQSSLATTQLHSSHQGLSQRQDESLTSSCTPSRMRSQSHRQSEITNLSHDNKHTETFVNSPTSSLSQSAPTSLALNLAFPMQPSTSSTDSPISTKSNYNSIVVGNSNNKNLKSDPTASLTANPSLEALQRLKALKAQKLAMMYAAQNQVHMMQQKKLEMQQSQQLSAQQKKIHMSQALFSNKNTINHSNIRTQQPDQVPLCTQSIQTHNLICNNENLKQPKPQMLDIPLSSHAMKIQNMGSQLNSLKQSMPQNFTEANSANFTAMDPSSASAQLSLERQRVFQRHVADLLKIPDAPQTTTLHNQTQTCYPKASIVPSELPSQMKNDNGTFFVAALQNSGLKQNSVVPGQTNPEKTHVDSLGTPVLVVQDAGVGSSINLSTLNTSSHQSLNGTPLHISLDSPNLGHSLLSEEIVTRKNLTSSPMTAALSSGITRTSPEKTPGQLLAKIPCSPSSGSDSHPPKMAVSPNASNPTVANGTGFFSPATTANSLKNVNLDTANQCIDGVLAKMASRSPSSIYNSLRAVGKILAHQITPNSSCSPPGFSESSTKNQGGCGKLSNDTSRKRKATSPQSEDKKTVSNVTDSSETEKKLFPPLLTSAQNLKHFKGTSASSAPNSKTGILRNDIEPGFRKRIDCSLRIISYLQANLVKSVPNLTGVPKFAPYLNELKRDIFSFLEHLDKGLSKDQTHRLNGLLKLADTVQRYFPNFTSPFLAISQKRVENTESCGAKLQLQKCDSLPPQPSKPLHQSSLPVVASISSAQPENLPVANDSTIKVEKEVTNEEDRIKKIFSQSATLSKFKIPKRVLEKRLAELKRDIPSTPTETLTNSGRVEKEGHFGSKTVKESSTVEGVNQSSVKFVSSQVTPYLTEESRVLKTLSNLSNSDVDTAQKPKAHSSLPRPRGLLELHSFINSAAMNFRETKCVCPYRPVTTDYIIGAAEHSDYQSCEEIGCLCLIREDADFKDFCSFKKEFNR